MDERWLKRGYCEGTHHDLMDRLGVLAEVVPERSGIVASAQVGGRVTFLGVDEVRELGGVAHCRQEKVQNHDIPSCGSERGQGKGKHRGKGEVTRTEEYRSVVSNAVKVPLGSFELDGEATGVTGVLVSPPSRIHVAGYVYGNLVKRQPTEQDRANPTLLRQWRIAR